MAITVAILMAISGFDDLFIDIYYWIRRLIRANTVYKRHSPMHHDDLYSIEERPLAIMIPAWQEKGVVGSMAELAASTLDYENYYIFVGTYPNDPETQAEVDVVCATFPNVFKVVCAQPGPTSKADCLNNILDAIMQFEQRAKVQFSGFILHDAEDVISPLELRLFNYLVDRKDLIQIPVYPFARQWYNFTGQSYIEEFAELHGKDVPVREAISGQVPSAGVGTCFSRRAINTLLREGDGIAFDTQSLTEDYDIGFRLKAHGLNEAFVRFPVVEKPEDGTEVKRKFLQGKRTMNVICVQEYFPDKFSAAVRQKSRWIIGIVFQGFKSHKWSSDFKLNYFLWRDRKGLFSNFLSFIAMIIMIQLVLILIYQWLWPDAWQFLSVFQGDQWLVLLLWINFWLMCNRILQRVIFVTSYYGLGQGLLSIIRLFWGNLINFMANWRALKQVLTHDNVHRIAWDKTTHDFPTVSSEGRSLRPIGDILLQNKALSEEVLNEALMRREPGLRIGGSLIHQGHITAQDLAMALAEQHKVDNENIDIWQIPHNIIERVPNKIALHYAILPLRYEGNILVVASESGIDPVTLAAISRKLAVKVRYVIVPRGQVTIGLRHWYVMPKAYTVEREILQYTLDQQWLTDDIAIGLWDEYSQRQVLFAEILITLGHIQPSALRSLLIEHEHSPLKLGEFLLEKGVISVATLEEALRLQEEYQVSILMLLEAAGLSDDRLKLLKEKFLQ